MIRIACVTQFDITATGVVGRYQEGRATPNHEDGVHQDRSAWSRARNQQRNWDTMNQIIALRCLPERIEAPQRHGSAWRFEFDIPDLAAVSDQPGDLEFLIRDADQVPMITGLDENPGLDPTIRTRGSCINTEFQVISDKYQLGE